MKKLFFIAVFAALSMSSLLAATPTLEIIGDKVQYVTVNGKTYKFDGEIKEINGQKVMAFGEKPLAVPAKTLVGEKGTIVMEYAIDTKNSKSAARPLMCLRLDGPKQIAFFTFHGNPVIQLRFGNPVFADKKIKLAANKIYQSAITWDGDKIAFYLDGKLLKEMKQPVAVNPKYIGNLTVGPFKDRYFVTPTWDNDCFLKSLKVYNEALSANDIANLK